MHNPLHTKIRAAYSFYNVANSVPLNRLMNDALILAKNVYQYLFSFYQSFKNIGIDMNRTNIIGLLYSNQNFEKNSYRTHNCQVGEVSEFFFGLTKRWSLCIFLLTILLSLVN